MPSTDLTGRQIDSYRVEALLGEGGMGSVYRAHDLNLARPVALKVMHAHLARNPQFQKRFMQEAQSAARLAHPSIVDIHYFGVGQELLYMVMAYIPGGSLKQYLKQLQQGGQVVEIRETLALLAQVADALGYAHAQGVVHRDIKPDNVLLERLSHPDRLGDPPMRAVVTDFGLAKLLEGGVETATGTVMGTLPYMSPEQVLGDKDIDGRSDLYSLGVMLYQMTTGRLPFDIQSPTDAVMKHLNEVPPPPSAFRPGVPPKVEVIIKKALAKKPEERIQSGETMARAMRLVAGELSEADVTHFAPPETVLSLVTQLLPEQQRAEPSRLGDELTALPGRQRILIARSGENPRSIMPEKDWLTVGRAEDNDICLPVEGLSRYHARLERLPSGGWQVYDLGSTNGTFVAGSRLLPDVPQPWAANVALKVGPYRLRWQEAEGGPSQPLRPGPSAYPATQPETAMVKGAAQGTLRAVAQPAILVVSPGGHSEVQVELFNQGLTVDHYTMRAEGLPGDWVQISQDSIQLMPGQTGSLRVIIQPPQASQARAGQHPYRLVISSLTRSGESAVVSGVVTINPFQSFSAEMRPSRLRHRGICRVLLRNEGNSAASFVVAGRDPAGDVDFQPPGRRVNLEPGGQDTVDFEVRAKNRPWLGGSRTLPFEMKAGPEGAGPQTLSGQLDVLPRLPAWLLALLAILFVLLCLAAGSAFVLLDRQSKNATVTAQALVEAQGAAESTRTAQLTREAQSTAQAEEAANGTATAIAQTAVAEGDSDGDGLSNSRELAEGTDPAKADTDGDGLSDGEEINRFGTLPKQQDSDGDTLLDGEEVNTHGTSPTNRDTDLDGQPDGVEVRAGTDPLRPPEPSEPAGPTGGGESPVSPAPAVSGLYFCLEPCLDNGANAVSSFPEGTTSINVRWIYENIPTGAHYVRRWSSNGQEWVRYDCTWPGPASGLDRVPLTEPDGLRSGTWEVSISVNDQVLASEQFIVEGNWNFFSPAGVFNSCYGRR